MDPSIPQIVPRANPAPSGKRPSHIGRNILAVYGTLSGIFVFLLLCLLIAIAAVGIIRVPGLGWLYRAPQPTRVVQTTELLSTTQFSQLIQRRLEAQMIQNRRPPFTFALTEQELTAALRGSIVPALRDPSIKMEQVQVVVLPNELELSGRFTRSIFHFDLLMRAHVTVKNAAVSVEPTSLQVDRLPISKEMAAGLISALFQRDIGSLALTVGEYGPQDVTLTDGVLRVTIGIVKRP